jgi:hypothetical protein
VAVNLRLDWCSHEAAKYAVENWHYSKRMPMPPLLLVGVWEDGEYIGCVMFNRGANHNLSKPYALGMMEVGELCRVAMRQHTSSVTRVVSIAIKFLRKKCPGLRLIVSFADPSEGHHGGIYQGGNWIYTGQTDPGRQYFCDGRWKHSREVEYGGFGNGKAKSTVGMKKRFTPGKHRYLMPLDAEMRAKILPLAKPYPKRAGSIASDVPATHAD